MKVVGFERSMGGKRRHWRSEKKRVVLCWCAL